MGVFDFLRSSSDADEVEASGVDEENGAVDGSKSQGDPSESGDGTEAGVNNPETATRRSDGVVEAAIPSAPEGTPATARGIHDLRYDPSTDRHFVVEAFTTDDDGPIGARHLALTDLGRRFSDTWLREELGDLLEGEDPELAAALETAYLSDTLPRKLIVTRTRPGTLRADDSIEGPDFSIDDVDVNNPSGGA